MGERLIHGDKMTGRADGKTNVHLVLAIIVTVFSLMLIVVTCTLSWEMWMVLLIILGLLLVWGLRIVPLVGEDAYEYLCSGIILFVLFFYGVHETSLFDLPITMGVFIVTLSMLDKKILLCLSVLTYLLVLLYHGIFLHTISLTMSPLEFSRLVLDVIAMFSETLLVGYMIGRRKKKNEDVRELTEQLETAKQQNADFLSNMSHELRTPINVVTGISGVLLGQEFSKEQREDIQSVQIAGIRLAEQMKDILDYTEIVENALVVLEERYMMSSILADLIAVQKKEKELELVFDMDVNLPAVLIGDGEKIFHILKHITDNAMKYTKEGGVYVHIGFRKENYHLMPEMDGIACIHALRRQEGGLCQETPVIALTANAGSDSQLLYKKEGFSGYLAKPVSGMLLEAAVLSILPEELVVVSEDGGQTEIGRDVLMFDQKLRLPLTITTDSGSDLPEELIEELGLSVCPYYVYTEKGRFLDMVEMVPDDLLAHVMEGRKGHSQSPEMADYEQFFARELTRAQNIIHITMTKGTSNAYRNAVEAAKSFENVTVLDSELISGGTGMMVMYAARMAKQGASKTEVLAALKSMRRRIPADFIINDTQMLYQAGRFPKGMKAMCDALLAHPIVGIHRNRMTMGGIRFGDFGHAGRSFIRSLLKKSRDIDKSAAFIIYVGMNEEAIAQIRQTVLQYCAFEKIYIQKASAAISINCGPGTFGLFYLRKEKQREFM